MHACVLELVRGRKGENRESAVTYVENRISFLSTVNHLLYIPTSGAGGNFETHPTLRLLWVAGFFNSHNSLSHNSPRFSTPSLSPFVALRETFDAMQRDDALGTMIQGLALETTFVLSCFIRDIVIYSVFLNAINKIIKLKKQKIIGYDN